MSESGRLKKRSQNLLHFSQNRTSSDAEAQYNAGAPKSETLPARSATPQVGNHQQAPLPTKKEPAALARLPMNTMRPKPAAAPSKKPVGGGNNGVQPLPDSPPRKLQLGRFDQTTQIFRPQRAEIAEPTPVVDAGDHDETKSIFAGDSLPEDCLASGYTTELMVGPDEDDDNLEARIQSQPVKPRQAAPRREDGGQSHRPGNFDLGEKHHHAPKTANGGLVFHTDGSGKMAVAHVHQRLEASQVRDGFQNEPLAERRPYHATHNYRPATTPPLHGRTEIPIRQVNVTKEQRAHKRNPHSRNYSSAYEKDKAPKQSRQAGRKQEAQTVVSLTDDGGPDSDGYEDEDEEDIYETPKPKAKQARTRVPPQDHLLGSALRPPTMDLSNHHNRKRNRPAADYDDKVLSSMSWADLQKEPFDHDPAQAAHIHGQAGSETDQLTKNLERLKSETDEDQRAFFCRASMEDWEKSGDWFVDQFADLMKKLRDARREKREMVGGFEKEAAQREEAVRQRSEAIDRKLAKMRQDGRRVVGGS